MAILAGDIKLVASQVMDDVDEGGGAPTASVIVDGASNAVFADVSEVDRAGGDVSVRKVFVTVQTDNRDTYLGSNVIIAEPPEDPRVSVSLFSTGDVFDRRADARDRIESYLAPGQEWSGYLLENHITGQSSVRLLQRVGTATPQIGQTLVLVYQEGQATERSQYVRVIDVSSETQTFTYMNGSEAIDFLGQVVTCSLSDALRYDFPGSPPARTFARTSTATKVRDTVVANAARYYGVARTTEAIAIGDVAARVDGIFTQLVPSAQTEIPLIDQTGAGQTDTVVDAASGTVSYTTAQPLGSGTALSLGNAVVPETLEIAHPGGSLTDFGGQLYAGAEVVGTVDYPRGTVTMATGAPTYSGAKTVTFRPAAAPLVLADTAVVPVTAESRAYNYVRTFLPPPQPGTLVVSYRSNGRWYDLRDNGSGQLKGADAAFGAGTVSYATGTVAVTLGALPDVGGAVLYAWGARPNYINRSAMSVAPPRVPMQLSHGGVTPGSVVIEWNDGATRTATDDGQGGITGDATGSIRYHTGAIDLTPGTLPAGGQVFDVSYSWDAPFEEAFESPGATINLGQIDITPGSVEVEWTLQYPAMFEPQPNYPLDLSRIARDDGVGSIRLDNGIVVGTINYSTGVITVTATTFSAAVPEMQYAWGYRVS